MAAAAILFLMNTFNDLDFHKILQVDASISGASKNEDIRIRRK